MFNRSPILRVRETTRDKDIYIDRGILVNYYHCYRETITTWKNAKYLCSQKEVQETEEVPILNTFYARIIDVNSAYIVVLPYNDMEERAISDKFEIHLSDFNASLYHVNTNVKITYDGKISEGELPQIEASKIEIKSADSFELIFTETGKGKKQIINKRKEMI